MLSPVNDCPPPLPLCGISGHLPCSHPQLWSALYVLLFLLLFRGILKADSDFCFQGLPPLLHTRLLKPHWVYGKLDTMGRLG